jgi:hypothetical protein
MAGTTTGTNEVFQMAGSNGSRDEKGVVSHVVPYFCPKGTDPTSDDIGHSPPQNIATEAAMKEQSRSWKDNGDGSYTVYVTFEGGVEGGINAGTQGAWFSGDEATYEVSASLKDIPIENHPGIAGLMQTYHGTRTGNGVVEFAIGTPDQPNPMYGVKTFKCVSATLRRTKIVSSVASDIFEGTGSVTTKVGSFPTMNYMEPDGKGGVKSIAREWLKLAPTIAKRGSKFTVTEEYMLSPKGGFPQYMYELIQV